MSTHTVCTYIKSSLHDEFEVTIDIPRATYNNFSVVIAFLKGKGYWNVRASKKVTKLVNNVSGKPKGLLMLLAQNPTHLSRIGTRGRGQGFCGEGPHSKLPLEEKTTVVKWIWERFSLEQNEASSFAT